jgi:hypothetical protein
MFSCPPGERRKPTGWPSPRAKTSPPHTRRAPAYINRTAERSTPPHRIASHNPHLTPISCSTPPLLSCACSSAAFRANPSARPASARRMAEAGPTTNGGGIGAILAAGDRDFLVRNSGEQVKPPPSLSLLSSLLPLGGRGADSLIGAVRGRIVCPWLVAYSSFFF